MYSWPAPTLTDLVHHLPILFAGLLAFLWLLFGLGLAMATYFGLHLAPLLGFITLAVRRRPAGRWLNRIALPLEVVYGWIHPLAYLLIFTRASDDGPFFVDVRRSWMDPAAWVLLLSLWALRIAPLTDEERRRRWARPLLLAGLVWLGLYFLRDFTHALLGPSEVFRNLRGLSTISYPLGILALYLTPAAILLRFLKSTRDPDRWRLERAFVLGSRRDRRILLGGLLPVALCTAVLLHNHPSREEAREKVLSLRSAISGAADATGADPRLVAALLYTLEQRQGSPFASRLERVLARAWQQDPGNHMMLGDALNPSLGLAQIKPATAQTALHMVAYNLPENGRFPFSWKEYRSVPFLGEAWTLPRGLLADLQPEPGWLPGKGQVVLQLERERSSIWMCAVILELFARQWEHANPSWSIRDRPEILATLYQLGFERSHPKAEPRSGDFGERVARAMDEPWVKAAFGE